MGGTSAVFIGDDERGAGGSAARWRPSWAVYEALRAAFGSKVPPPPPETQVGTTLANPYRGLLVFGVKDAPLFFGRMRNTAELRQLSDAAVQPPPDAGLVPPRLVSLIGTSGSGKSSLAQEGLLADLLHKPPVGAMQQLEAPAVPQ